MWTQGATQEQCHLRNFFVCVPMKFREQKKEHKNECRHYETVDFAQLAGQDLSSRDILARTGLYSHLQPPQGKAH